MKKLYLLITGLIFSFGSFTNVYGQCTGASLSCCQFNPITTTFQTISFQHNVYKTFTAVAGKTYMFTYCSNGGTTTFDNQITILDNLGVPVALGYNDDFCGTAAQVTWTAPSSATFRVMTTTFNCILDANVSTMAYGLVAPLNDACVGSIAVAIPSTTAGSTTEAIVDTAPTCITGDGTGGGVWYTLVGNGNILTASLCTGTTYDSKIRVFTGSCGALTCITGDDDGCGTGASTVTWGSVNGTTYRILVHGFGSSVGNFSLAISSSGLATEPTTQPTNLVFSSITQTGFSFSFTGNGSDGYITLRKAGSYPTSTPVDGVVYTIASTLGDADVAYVGTSTSLTTTSLSSGTAYYHRIYAYNGSGTARNYRIVSPLQNFVTTLVPPGPSVTTTAITNIGAASATSGGNVTADNGAAVTARGVVWSTSPSPTTALTTKTSDGTGTGVFTSSITGLSTSTLYYVRSYATNTNGTTYGSQLSFTTLADGTPPTVTDGTLTKVTDGTSITFTLNVTDASLIGSVYIDYGMVEKVENIYDFFDDFVYDDADVDYIELTNSTGSTYTGSIPASDVGKLGVIYVISAYDEYDNEFLSSSPKIITVESGTNGISIPYTTPGSGAANYKIISVPLNLAKKGVNDVFGDDIEPYGNKESYRLFRYQSGKTNELTGTSPIDPGKGYWLISKNAATIDSGPGMSVVTSVGAISATPSTLSLTTGWNQIGNPYGFNILWSDVVAANSSLNLGALRSFSSGSFGNSTTLRVNEGGFVMVQSAGNLTFPIIRNSAAGRLEEVVKKTNSTDTDDWEVSFSINAGDLINEFGGFGMNPQAENLNDRFDDFTLPRFLDYLELNHHKTFLDIPISKDIVPSQKEYVWDFDVVTNTSTDLISISWDNSYFGSERKLVLWDVARQRAIDMHQVNSYQFSGKESSSFKVYAGNELFIKEAVSTNQVVFHEVFPNPAQDHVTFGFSIPNTHSNRPITLQILDGMGRNIEIVANKEFEAGYHEVRWDIKENANTPSGIYFGQLKDGVSTQTIKFIIK